MERSVNRGKPQIRAEADPAEHQPPLRNKAVRTQVKSATKRLETKVVEKDLQLALDELKSAKSTIAKAAKKGVLHRNTASRKISRLERMVNTLNP